MSITISSVTLPFAEIPSFSFGSGKKALVMFPGIFTKSLMTLSEAVKLAFDDFTEDYTFYVFERQVPLNENCTIEQTAALTADALDALGVGKACVYGVSTGGMIAQCLAAQRGDLVQKLALISTAPYIEEEPGKAMGEIGELFKNGEIETAGRMFARLVYSRDFYEKYEKAIIDTVCGATEQELQRFIRLTGAVVRFDGRSALENIKCPSVVVGGAQDRIFSKQLLKDTARTLGCPLMIYDGYGHAVYDELPQVKKDVFAFFSE